MSVSRTAATPEQCVRLLSSDNIEHRVPRSVLKQCKMIERLIVNLRIEGDFDNQPPIMISVHSDVLELIIEWLKKHKNDDEPMIADCEGSTSRKVPKWDKEFFRPLAQSKVFELVKASHHLDIKRLTDIACKTIASWMSGKEAPEIRSMFGLENDLTEEEKKQSEREYKVLEECTCTPAHQTTRGFELRMFDKLKQMESDLDAMDRQHDELVTELNNLKLRAKTAQMALSANSATTA